MGHSLTVAARGLRPKNCGTREGAAAKIKKAPAGYPGPCTQRIGGGRGLAARDAVCIDFTITVSDPHIKY